jgi:hypothetical protein
VSPNIGLIVLNSLGTYFIEVPLRNPREGYTGVGGLTALRHGQAALVGGVKETLKPWTPHPGGTPNGLGQATRRRWSRTHVPMLQHIVQHSHS